MVAPTTQDAGAHAAPDSTGTFERLTSQLADPATARAVSDLLTMAPDLAAAARMLMAFVQRSSQIAENVNGIVETARQSAGVAEGGSRSTLEKLEHVKEQVARGGRLFDEVAPILEDEQTLASLRELTAALPKLLAFAKLFELFIGRSSVIAENLNGVVDTFRQALNARWTSNEDRARIAKIPGQLMETVESPALHRLLASRVLSEEALGVMNRVAGCVIEGDQRAQEMDTQIGPLGLLKALRDPDVQRGVGEAIEIARAFGRMRAEAQPRA